MTYNGAKESPKHFELKTFLADRLRGQGLDPHVEKVVIGKGLSPEWKKPDVRVQYGNIEIVFELQISNTFLDVIVKRERFYRENEMFIVWVFGEFDLSPFTAKDIVYPNQHHAFVLNDRAKKESIKRGRLILECFFPNPQLRPEPTALPHQTRWGAALISLNDLTFDQDRWCVYYIDWEGQCARMEKAARDNDVTELIEYAFVYGDRNAGTEMVSRLLKELQIIYMHPFAILPREHASLIRLLGLLYSMKHGRVVFYSLPNLTAFANHLIDYSAQHIGHLLGASLAYQHQSDVLSKNSVRKKLSEYKQNPQRVVPCHRHDWLVERLFPEIAKISSQEKKDLFAMLTSDVNMWL
jgi:hypothetical protein